MYNKSIIFRSAHAIFKMQNVTFSEALTLAWEKTKKDVKAVIVKSNKLVKSAGLGYETVYFNELAFTNITTPKTSQPYNASIEKYYVCGMYNND